MLLENLQYDSDLEPIRSNQIMSFKEISFPRTYTYSSDSEHLPLNFYKNAFAKSVTVDLLLGYYSSSAFKILSESFVEFIDNGGTMRLAINHFLSEEDKDLIFNAEYEFNETQIERIINSFDLFLGQLKTNGKLFFDCLRYLIEQERISFVSIVQKPFKLAHFKESIFYDGSDYLYTNGSANFTASGLNMNAESFYVHRSWSQDGQTLIDERILHFQSIFNQTNDKFIYIDDKSLIATINKHTEKQSLDRLKSRLKEFEEPRKNNDVSIQVEEPKKEFFKPRDYQNDAYLAWKQNNYVGLFSMATGTGKTKTALYCLQQEKETRGYLRAIIAVPSQLLVTQWHDESLEFGFRNVFTYKHRDWQNKLRNVNTNLTFNIASDFIFICTYATLASGKIETALKVKKHDIILIADEAHNIGAPKTKAGISQLYKNRLGLSATPSRKYDTIGSEFINKYFHCSDNGFTYNYSLYKAIQKGWLTPYKYFIKFVSLEDDELNDYLEYTKRLLKFFDFESGEFHDGAKKLLIQRKRIIHKARNKQYMLSKVIDEISSEKKIDHTIVYVPEGIEYSDDIADDEESKKVIDLYSKIIDDKELTTYQIINTSENIENALNHFKSGRIQVLTAMKMLDEGVDIPSTKRAIFCSSTGNPKQFIQRRGRILRKFDGKKFAEVYDMVITPSDGVITDPKMLEMELKIFKNELNRVIDFLYASLNIDSYISQSTQEAVQLNDLCESANLSLVDLIQEKMNDEKTTE